MKSLEIKEKPSQRDLEELANQLRIDEVNISKNSADEEEVEYVFEFGD